MNNTRPSYYDILNISPSSSDEEVKRAYHALAKRFHPDANRINRFQAERYFRIINEAYATLKTREKRIAYNKTLRLSAQNDNKNTGGFFAQIGEIFRPKDKETSKR